MRSRHLALIALIATLLVGQPQLALSEEEAPYEDKLPAFAEALSAIYVIVQRYEQQMVAVETESERRLLAVAARHAIHRAIDRVPGISVEEYDEIATGVREDGGLEAAVHEALRVRLGTTRPDRRRARPGDAE